MSKSWVFSRRVYLQKCSKPCFGDPGAFWASWGSSFDGLGHEIDDKNSSADGLGHEIVDKNNSADGLGHEVVDKKNSADGRHSRFAFLLRNSDGLFVLASQTSVFAADV